MARFEPRVVVRALLLLVLLAGVLLAARPAAAISIAEFPLPNAGAEPGGIVAGPGGELWFTEIGADRIGRLTTAGAFAGDFAVTGGDITTEFPAAIAVGPDGDVWFTELTSNLIGRITPAGTVTQFHIPSADSNPVDIVGGPDGNLWFTEDATDRIGRITTAGKVTEFTVPTAGAGLLGITAGPDGNLWFTEAQAGKIGRLTPAGVFQEFPLAAGRAPAKIVTGPDGNLWFAELSGNRIGRLTPAGALTEFALPTPDASPFVLVAAPDGNLWFTEVDSGKVGRITVAGVITEFSPPSASSQPAGIAVGPDGNLWFTEIATGKIGRISIATASVCTPGASTLCLDDQPGDRRFKVGVSFRSTEGGGVAGNGAAIPLNGVGVTHGGLFWFFNAANPEMLVKVLNACPVNQRFWVFSAATTNVGYTLTVTDTRNGRQKVYTNQDGHTPPPVQDTSAFACSSSTDLAPDTESDAAAGIESSDPAGLSLSAELAGWQAALARLDSDALAPRLTPAECTPNATTLCVNGRFALTVAFHTQQGGGRSGAGQAITLTGQSVDQGGLFWFFGHDNPEMLIKVLDGCPLNNHYWIFYAAGTNVGFTVTVTDRKNGHSRTYSNIDGTAAPAVQDTSGLSCS